MPRKKSSLEERFWKRVDIRDSDECWPWTGYKTKAGYGRIHDKRGDWDTLYAHRVSWNIAHPNDIAKDGRHGDNICHSCDNPSCVNPHHLWKGTQADNVRDMMNKNRLGHHDSSGSRNSRAKLKESDIPIIRKLKEQGYTYWAIADTFGVSASSIGDILNGRHWKGY